MPNAALRQEKCALPLLPPGTPVGVAFGQASVPSPGRLVGYEEGEYLIVAMSAFKARHVLFLRGAAAQVQAECQGARYEFHSSLLGSSRKPRPLLFLAFPTSVRALVQRKNRRVPCTLPCRVWTEDGSRQAVLRNLSRGGCGLSLPLADREEPPIAGGAIVDVELRLPDAKHWLTGLARGLTVRENRLDVGLQFFSLTTDARQGLDKLIDCLGG